MINPKVVEGQVFGGQSLYGRVDLASLSGIQGLSSRLRQAIHLGIRIAAAIVSKRRAHRRVKKAVEEIGVVHADPRAATIRIELKPSCAWVSMALSCSWIEVDSVRMRWAKK